MFILDVLKVFFEDVLYVLSCFLVIVIIKNLFIFGVGFVCLFFVDDNLEFFWFLIFVMLYEGKILFEEILESLYCVVYFGKEWFSFFFLLIIFCV